ncbi:MAG: hypothetical protein JWL62_433 [Hyphomicrobiales bacterium]|nr:hypothetical protein [Hyphomicrobiales bacterium]
MIRRVPVYLVCSPHARVGTSTTARLLADYHRVENRAVRAFDTDPYGLSLSGFFAGESTVADLSTTRGQIALFDRLLLPGEETRIVDIWNRSYRQFFSQAQDIGFFEEADRLDLSPIIVFGTDGSDFSVASARELKRAWPDLQMIVVSNEGAVPLGDDEPSALQYFLDERTFQISALDPIMRRQLEQPGFSLSDFLVGPPQSMSLVVRADLRNWVRRVFAQFQSYELRNALDETRYLLR